MGQLVEDLHVFLLLLLYPFLSNSFPQCNNLRSPTNLKGHLVFCSYTGKVCCNSTQDQQLRKQFLNMNISDAACASAVKSILCARCDPFAAKLFDADSELRPVPILCNSTSGAAVSSLSIQNNSNSSFCSAVWDSCRDVSILNSPFAPSWQTKAQITLNTNEPKLTDIWQSKSDFCTAFGAAGDENAVCFNGEPVTLNSTDTLPPPRGLCLEKVGNGSYLTMVPHPDGSNRAFFSTQIGKIFLATIPEQDSGELLGLDESSPFVDLTDQVSFDQTFGLMGMAFHPNFAKNGRFFASFNCDASKSSSCRGTCGCNSDVGCDPSKLGTLVEGEPCKFHTVIAEYSANGTASSPSMAKMATPQEVRRIFTMGLPFRGNHGGQIIFGPADGYLYIMMGDGGSKGDPYNFAQNKKSVFGKIMRVDIDNIPSEEEILKHGLWGSYSAPKDNPHSDDKEIETEIWAYGFRNPWGCSFDPERPSYFLCADIGQDEYEEVNIISKGGNYGWRVYEGPLPFHPQQTPGGNSSAASIDPIFPVLGYSHSDLKLGSAVIVGGRFYRAQTDPCTYGSYLYGDLYAKLIWAASENPRNSGNFTATNIPFTCATDSPIKCDIVANSNLPALQYVFAFGEDNRKDVYILTQSGVYRVVRPSRCNYACSKEVITPKSSPTDATSKACPCPIRANSALLSLSAGLIFMVVFL